MKTTIGIPAFNEEKNIAKMIVKLKKISDEIIVCNDGSSDLTGEIAEKMGAIVINHEKNLGYGAGINSIIKKSKEIDTDILVTFDADGQHRIEDIETVTKPIINGEADLVIGSRFLDEGKKEVPGYRKLGINIITKVTNSGLKEKITDSQSGFRAYSRELISKFGKFFLIIDAINVESIPELREIVALVNSFWLLLIDSTIDFSIKGKILSDFAFCWYSFHLNSGSVDASVVS